MPQYTFNESLQALFSPEGTEIKLRPQSLDVFRLLLEHKGTVVTKEIILKSIWGNLSVTDDSVTQCIADIRRALGKDHRELLQTVPKKGYQLCSDIDVVSTSVNDPLTLLSGDQNSRKAVRKNRFLLLSFGIVAFLVITTMSLFVYSGRASLNNSKSSFVNDITVPGFHGEPTMAVLPFKNTSPSQTNEYFSDGITEDIINALTRFSSLRIMSWNAVSKISSDQVNAKQIANQFGIQYLVTGSVQRSDNRVRIIVQLSDALKGRVLWSEKYDEPLQDVFLLQDKISKQVVTTVSVKLSKIETERAFAIPTRSMAAYELVLIGRSLLRQRSRENNLAARSYFEKAIALDPSYTEALSQLGESYVDEAMLGWTEWPEQSLEKAFYLANIAIKSDSQNPEALGFLSLVYFRLGKLTLSQIELDRAFSFNPNNPKLHVVQGLIHSRTGRIDSAIASLEYARMVDPDIQPGWTELGASYYMIGRIQDAILTFKRGLDLDPDIIFGHVMLAAAQVEANNLRAAEKSAAEVRRVHPFFSSVRFARMGLFSDVEKKSRIVTALKSAGLN